MNAIGYIRISTKDQSSYSLEYQERIITNYCLSNKLNLLAVFKDDGESSYTFDRPDWKALETFIKKNKQVTHLIILDHDRFSRNLAEALLKIKELSEKYKIKVLATTDSIDTDFSDPNTFMVRAFKYMMAESELHRIRQRIKHGQVQAAMNGRFGAKAPFGYTNGRDMDNKPLLIIDEPKARIVRSIFKEFIAGCDIEQIRIMVKMEGFKFDGNSTLQKMLVNHVYAGKIKVPEIKGKKSYLVHGIHAPIISEETFWTAHNIITGQQKGPALLENPEVPLKGILKCWCGRYMTAGNSRGKSGKHYWYYLCKTHKENLPAKKLHKEFDELLDQLSMLPEDLQYIRNGVIGLIKDRTEIKEKAVGEISKELKSLKNQITAAEEKFLTQASINPETYKKVMGQYKIREGQLRADLAAFDLDDNLYLSRLNDLLPKLTNIKHYYKMMDRQKQKQFINMVFNQFLYYRDNSYRTPSVNIIFAGKLNGSVEKGPFKIEQPFIELGKFPLVGLRGTESNIIDDLMVLSEVFAA